MTDLNDVSWVGLTFVDVFGLLNSVQLPAERFGAAVSEGEPFDGSALEGRTRYLEADMLLRPDPDSVMRLDVGTQDIGVDDDRATGRPGAHASRAAKPRCARRAPWHSSPSGAGSWPAPTVIPGGSACGSTGGS